MRVRRCVCVCVCVCVCLARSAGVWARLSTVGHVVMQSVGKWDGNVEGVCVCVCVFSYMCHIPLKVRRVVVCVCVSVCVLVVSVVLHVDVSSVFNIWRRGSSCRKLFESISGVALTPH